MDGKLKAVLEEAVTAVRSTEEYLHFAKMRCQLETDEALCRLMKRYEQAQTALQTAALTQSEPDEEDVEEFRRLNLLLLDSEPASAYLMAKMKYDHTLSEVFEYLSSGLEMNLPGRED